MNNNPAASSAESLKAEGHETLLEISGLNVSYDGISVLRNINMSIARGENWLVCGESGSGKSTLGKVVAGQLTASGKLSYNFSPRIPLPACAYYVENWYKFSDLEGDRNFYYQQRYNKHDKNDTLTVYAELEKFGRERSLDERELNALLDKFGFDDCRQIQLIELSSGEHKKLQLLMALWLKPQFLILDEPYTGLDSLSRKNLNSVLDAEAQTGVTYLLITNSDEIPISVSRYAEMSEGGINELSSPPTSREAKAAMNKPVPYFLQKAPTIDSDIMINVQNVNVKYGEKSVLKNVSWTVKAGEKWALQGRNGSGKSTLLSLLDGDHPQAYANNITLFGKRRGTGESIWDIKEKIGIISPEMHWFFDQNATVWHTVASGFHDSIGWFLEVSDEEKRKMDLLLEYFGLSADKDKLLTILPLGKQRLALLARTMIKNPQLLILDEPCQGLDDGQTQFFNSILDALSVYGKTIIYVGHYETRMPSCLNHRLILENGEVKHVE